MYLFLVLCRSQRQGRRLNHQREKKFSDSRMTPFTRDVTFAIEQERSIKENELNTEITIAEKEREKQEKAIDAKMAFAAEECGSKNAAVK